MAKSLLYRWFGLGKIPADLKSQLEAEGIVLQDEGISGAIIYKNFRSPTRYSSWRWSGFVGSLIVTNSRVVGVVYNRPASDILFTDPRLESINISVEGGQLRLAFDASLFRSDWSGQIEYRYNTPDAQAFADAITSRRVKEKNKGA
jgi:hypothetical protein